MGTSGLVVLPCCTRSVVWRRAIGSPDTVAVPDEWSTMLTLHYSCNVAACLHILHALTAVPARTSCRPMMDLTLSALEMWVYSCSTRGGIRPLPIREVRSSASRHMAASEPTLAGWQDTVLQDTWRCVGARPAPCLDLKLVCRGTWSIGYRQ
jgi:hypothetical protein